MWNLDVCMDVMSSFVLDPEPTTKGTFRLSRECVDECLPVTLMTGCCLRGHLGVCLVNWVFTTFLFDSYIDDCLIGGGIKFEDNKHYSSMAALPKVKYINAK